MPGDQQIKDRILDAAEQVLARRGMLRERFVEMGFDFVGPHVKQAIADGDFPDVDPRVVVEWCCRLTLSLITTPGTVQTDDPALLRRYIEDLLDIGSVNS